MGRSDRPARARAPGSCAAADAAPVSAPVAEAKSRFNAALEEAKAGARDLVAKRLDFLEGKLAGRDYLAGDKMSVADPYLFAMLGWTRNVGIDLARWPNLTAFRNRMAQREAVQAVLKAEGLA